MRRPRLPAALSLVALGLAACAFAGRSAAAEEPEPTIYKWVDQNGIAHYTTDRKRVPSNLRNRIQSVDELRRERGAPPPRALGGSEAWAVRDAGARPEQQPVGTASFRQIDPVSAARRTELDGRIRELETELAQEEQRLKELISEARLEEDKPAPLYGRPELEELARRFPQLQADLAVLRAERRRLDQEP